MTKKEQELLLQIAESVGELFDALEKNPEKSEITFDQRICHDLWNYYEAWSIYDESGKRASRPRSRLS